MAGKIRVYTASKLAEAPRWRALKDQWGWIDFTARWPFFHVDNVEDTPEDAVKFWVEDHEDVAKADVVLVYAEQDQHLRGALVEAGLAIALGKKVIVVGDHPDYGTWQYHPQVLRAANLDHAHDMLVEMSVAAR